MSSMILFPIISTFSMRKSWNITSISSRVYHWD